MTAWQDASIRVVAGHAIEQRRGCTYKGIGLVAQWSVLKSTWLVIHLNSGHAVARIDSHSTIEKMKDVAAEIADAGDWSFDGLNGFENMFPDAAQRVQEIVMKHFPKLRRRATPNVVTDPVAASAVARLREDELYAAAQKEPDDEG